MLTFEETSTEIAPMHLLLGADPSEKCIKNYLRNAWCFVARDQEQIAGVCIAREIKAGTAEIFNIAVDPAVQAQGIGTRLLVFAVSCLKDKQLKSVELGTGTFGYQLAFYQR
ncbi:GNAT family N-acetyltransferase [Kistimonas asteriae]|uniref:GNAT family N-acetyltransferase n=1 Tax=Kistimonas asteriae TaxID=517724 RepID=UPI0031B83113